MILTVNVLIGSLYKFIAWIG